MSVESPWRNSFPAMGTTIELVVWGIDREFAVQLDSRLRARAESWEATFSRFRPDSELSRLNGACGRQMAVSPEFFAVVSAAREGFISTGGRFDPTIVDALEHIGYNRSFAEFQGQSLPAVNPSPLSVARRFTLLDLELDEATCTVFLPEGMRIDLGGIAKGAFVDSVCDLVAGTTGAIVDAGGDIRCWGTPGDESSWRIGVQHPGQPDRDLAQLQLPVGESLAVATSSTRSRSWLTGPERQNHLIDPRTGRSVDWSSPNVTVVADTVTNAEIFAKSALIAIARGEPLPYSTAHLAVVANDDGTYETITPYASAA